MAIQFPADPSAQTPANTFGPDSTPLASPNDVTYTWDGEKWVAYKALDPGDFEDLFVKVAGDNMDGTLTLGTDKTVLYADGRAEFDLDVTVGGFPGAGSLDGNKLYRNGGLDISGSVGNAFQTFKTGVSDPFITFDLDGNGVFAGNVFSEAAIATTRFGRTSQMASEETINSETKQFAISVKDSASRYRATIDYDGNLLLGDDVWTDPSIKLNADTGDIQSTSQNGGQLAGTRNLLDNGGLTVNQRNDNSGNQTDEYVFACDRWALRSEKPDLQRSVLHKTDPNTLTDKTGMPYVQTTWQPTTKTWGYTHRMAPYRLMGINGKQVTLSFLSNVQLSSPSVYLQGNISGVTGPGQLFTMTEEPNPYGSTGYLYTGTTGILPDDFVSNKQNFMCLFIYNSNDITGGALVHEIAMLQMEVGPTRTEFEFEQQADTFSRCQYYFQRTPAIWDILGIRVKDTGSGSLYAHYTFPRTMFRSPTAVVKGVWAPSPSGTAAPSVQQLSPNGCRLATGDQFQTNIETVVRSIRSNTVSETGFIDFDAEPQ